MATATARATATTSERVTKMEDEVENADTNAAGLSFAAAVEAACRTAEAASTAAWRRRSGADAPLRPAAASASAAKPRPRTRSKLALAAAASDDGVDGFAGAPTRAPSRASYPPLASDMHPVRVSPHQWHALNVRDLPHVRPEDAEEDASRTLAQANPTIFDDRVRFVEKGHTYYLWCEATQRFRTHRLSFSVSKLWEIVKVPFDARLRSPGTATKNFNGLVTAVGGLGPAPSRARLAQALGPDAAAKLHASTAFRQIIAAAPAPAAASAARPAPSPPRGGGRGRGRGSGRGRNAFRSIVAGGSETHARVVARTLAATLPRSLGQTFGGLTPRSVRKSWRAIGTAAAVRGTYVHAQIERFYNGRPYDAAAPEVRIFLDEILPSNPELSRDLVFRTELSMTYAPLYVTGQADGLFRSRRTPGAFVLVDWKNSGKMWKRETITEAYREAFPDVDSTKAGLYCLQLGLYRFMLELEGFEIEEAFLVVTHPDHDGPRKIAVPYMPRQIVWLLDRHREKLERILASGRGRDPEEVEEVGGDVSDDDPDVDVENLDDGDENDVEL